ncbi:MAG: glucosidase [Verrucomicrobiae bacterium]|nr:glucosidase [Verrucomicrobiae bacterium]
MPLIAEKVRLDKEKNSLQPWKLFGPYLSERQWGTVREDYSPGGTAWEYFPHDHARSRAYRWGEDGIAGFSDGLQLLCLSLGLWNGRDPIIKERFFGLTNAEGNHGEDVKELYYYLDATPTHSYLKMLYKYPQREFPYAQLVAANAKRGRNETEFEILDTGIFDDDRYFDVFVEYAKSSPDDILMRVTVHNRGPEAAVIHVLPHLWFRNTWSWDKEHHQPGLRAVRGGSAVKVEHEELGSFEFYPGALDGGQTLPELLFTENETNSHRLYGGPEAHGFFKDAFHDYLVHGKQHVVNPKRAGTKMCAHYELTIPAGGSQEIKLRLQSSAASHATAHKAPETHRKLQPFDDFDAIFSRRIAEADEFYAELQHGLEDDDLRSIQRQALAGMIWSKQFYHFNVRTWLNGDPAQPSPPKERKRGRNAEWVHLNNSDIISMPDKWEYPWYAAWDLAFHCIPLALVDAEFAKRQLDLLTREWFMHPNGQLPAYEWAFSDVNPPVHAWATWRVFQMDRQQRRDLDESDQGDLAFLERVFHKLLLNFTWWVNRKDAQGRNIFQGGFLGLDNIGVFDRSSALPTGGFINQADGTSWMAMYCLNLLRISLELARHNKVYEDIATKFFEHFLSIAGAINGVTDGHGEMPEEGLALWDETDEFYYDELCLPDGRKIPLKVRSMVGLVPLFAVETLDPALLKRLPDFAARMKWFLAHRPDLANLVSRWEETGVGERHLLSLLRGHRMKCILRRALDETEFLSDHGIRALSKVHEEKPYRLDCGGTVHEVRYWPAESEGGLFGGNSNWRGPVWLPMNYLLIESLQKFHHYYGDDFKIECPTGSGKFLTINEVAHELSDRLVKLFQPGADGQRPALKSHPKLATDPHFKNYILFHEYFHGDTGRGVGASHQTGWTGIIAKLIRPRRNATHTLDIDNLPKKKKAA